MRKEVKNTVVEMLSSNLKQYPHFYLVDIEGLDAEKTAELRAECHKGDVKLVVVKNTLLRRAFSDQDVDFSELYKVLKGNTAVMFTEEAKTPAKIIKSFLKENKELGKPVLKAAYAQEGFYVGAEHLEALVSIKSREELLADVLVLLQSPAKNLASSLQSVGHKIHNVLKAIEEK